MLQMAYDNFFLHHTYILKFSTFLNGHLLGAPRKYVLHGLNPELELNWGSCRPASWVFFLFVLAHKASWCLFQWLKFHTHPSLLAGQLNTDIQVNNTVMPHFGTHIHISTLHSCYYSFSSLHFFHSLGQAGWLRLFPSDTGCAHYENTEKKKITWYYSLKKAWRSSLNFRLLMHRVHCAMSDNVGRKCLDKIPKTICFG